MVYRSGLTKELISCEKNLLSHVACVSFVRRNKGLIQNMKVRSDFYPKFVVK